MGSAALPPLAHKYPVKSDLFKSCSVSPALGLFFDEKITEGESVMLGKELKHR